MSTAERNRQIKQLLKKAFEGKKISVKGSRGTAHGWVRVRIGYSPRNTAECRDLESKVKQLISAAGIEIGTYGYDDPGSDYGYGQTININFDELREKADFYGPDGWKQRLGADEWDTIQKQNNGE